MRKTKIVCTIGPACNNTETLREMILSGMNVARLNFSHGDHEYHKNNIDMLKQLRDELQMPVAIMLDTSASTRLKPSADKIISLWNRLLYQPRVKPVKFERDLLSLKLNAIMTAMGRYMKQNTRMT